VQKQTRITPDQRFDLPHYKAMMDLIGQEFHHYNKSFISAENKVVKNWLISDNGGLEIKLNKSIDSVLFNSERVGDESLAVRDTSCDDLLLDLEDNSINYVEVELYSTTTGEDSVAIWDPTANSGQGEEFTQTVDTVDINVSHRLVSNVISFSAARPDRIPLAEVTTSGGSISGIVDSRDVFYHLDSDWDFGSPRTDKTIYSIKNDSDALKTSLKEAKDLAPWTASDEWYRNPGVGVLGLLERINYILVDGGNISWNLPKPASGSLNAIPTDLLTGILDGDTFTIDDGSTSVTFEFDTNSSGPANAVTVAEQASSTDVKTAMLSAIGSSALIITASSGDGDRIELVHDTDGTVGNISITESLSNGRTLGPVGMAGGFSGIELTWSDDLRIIAPGRAFEYTVSAQTVSNLADGELAYITLPREGTTPGGPLAVSTVASADYLIDPDNTRHYIIAYRSGTKIYFGNGWQSVEIEDGETTQLGDGITDEWLTATGLRSEFDSTPPYFSTNFITPGGSFTRAISETDAMVGLIYSMVAGPAYEEYVVSDGGAGFQIGSKIKLPPPFGLGGNQNYQTGLHQLEVRIDGRAVKQGSSLDWIESANIGAGIGDEIELRRPVNNGSSIEFRMQVSGVQEGTAAQYGRELGKLCKNNSGSPIALNKVVSWDASDGSMILADVSTATLVIGLVTGTVADGTFGTVIRAGSCPGAVSGLGATPGQVVYLGSAGALTLTPTAIKLGWAEPADGVASATTTDLWLQREI